MNTTQAENRIHALNQKCSYVLAYGSQPKSRGMMQRKAFYALCYGASIRTAVKTSGLSLRRVKVIAKQLPTL